MAERAREPEALELARRFTAPSAPADPLLKNPPDTRQQGIDAFVAGRREDALRLFDVALAENPDDVEALMSRAVVLQALSRGTLALASYDRAVALAEKGGRGMSRDILPDALASRAALQLELGKRKLAREDLRRALAAGGDDWPQRDAIRARLQALPDKHP